MPSVNGPLHPIPDFNDWNRIWEGDTGMESRREFASRAFAGVALGASLPLRGEPDDLAKKLQGKFIAPCCWNESVAVHRSESAAEMRAEIASMVTSGKSEEEIVAFYVAKHGERILLEPRGLKLKWLTAIPFVAFGAGGVSVARSIPYELTTVRVGLGFDLSRPLSRLLRK